MSRLFLIFWAGLLACLAVCRAEQAPARSTVYFAQNDSALESFKENPPAIRAMVDGLVCAVTAKATVAEAWSSLVKPTDRVGIKISATGGRYFATRKSVVAAIVDGLERAGVPGRNIIVWDRADMADAGYKARADYQVRSVQPVSGYDPAALTQSPTMGKLIWGDLTFTKNTDEARSKLVREPQPLSDESHWSRIISQEVTKIINVPVMRDAECGPAGCIYNVTIPNIDNWRRFLQPPGFGDPYICDLYADPRVGPKVVLNIMDALIAQFAGGPEAEPNYAFHFNTIYASRDPVAIDATALREMEKWRAQSHLPPFGPRAAYLQSAEVMRLGNFSPDRIDLRKVP